MEGICRVLALAYISWRIFKPLLTGFVILYDGCIKIAINLRFDAINTRNFMRCSQEIPDRTLPIEQLPSFSHYYLKVHLQVVQIMIKLVISVYLWVLQRRNACSAVFCIAEIGRGTGQVHIYVAGTKRKRLAV